jgi:hypothetical protein
MTPCRLQETLFAVKIVINTKLGPDLDSMTQHKATRKNPVQSFGDIFESVGTALRQIFDDPELKSKTRDFKKAATQSAQTLAGRFKDEEVKARFHDVGKAAEEFGKSVADSFKSQDKKNEDNNNRNSAV